MPTEMVLPTMLGCLACTAAQSAETAAFDVLGDALLLSLHPAAAEASTKATTPNASEWVIFTWSHLPTGQAGCRVPLRLRRELLRNVYSRQVSGKGPDCIQQVTHDNRF